jgi:hypothetical protein
LVSVTDGLEPVDGDVALTGGDEVPPVEGVEEVGELAGRLPVPVDVDVAVDDVDVDAPVPLEVTCTRALAGGVVNCW